ncbi:hypothetical protein [Halobellus rarus]|uniref:DUF8160 domain-containing protein n=1 Tax=Halobellus rarus TaxID=1126237 RepID=A0ABD6CVQ3_9EURY|nr:hypothetical protein [Halobellus rarus]
MTDRGNRSDRLRERFQGDTEDQEDPNTEEISSNTSKTTMTTDDSDSTLSETGSAVKDRPSVLMYLPEEIRQELDIRFDELNAKHKRQHGEALEKNRDYYPAVIEAGLTDKDLKDILDI